MNFLPGGKLLPGNWVEEAKLLFFIKMEVTNRPLKKKKNPLMRQKEKDKKKKKQLGGAVMVEGNEEHLRLLDESIIF